MNTATQPWATWTAYPSLLSSLLEEDQRTAFEEAAQAHYCGRYEDARSIFDARLPESSTIPILTLQRADMLTTQGCEPERIKLLQEGLNSVSTSANAPGLSVVPPLMELMLVDARFWAFGEMKPVVEILPNIRAMLRNSRIETLSDIELRCITLHYSLVDTFQGMCNYLGESDKTVFPGFQGNKVSEIKTIRKVLQSQARWRFIPTFMQLELANTTPGLTLRDAVMDALGLCSALESFSEPSIQFRSIILRKQIASTLLNVMPELAVSLQQQNIQTIQTITPTSYARWEDFCPVFAVDLRKTQILDSAITYPEKLQQLLEMIENAELKLDYTKANQGYISARDLAQTWLQTAKETGSASEAVESLRNVQERYMNFHRERTHMAFFEGSALSDLQTTLYVHYHDYPAMLNEGEKFQQFYPTFEVPRIQERLYDHAILAARHLGMIDKLKVVTDIYYEWLQDCDFVRGVSLTGEGISSTELIKREVITAGDDSIQWGVNAVRLMLRWAGAEWEQGLVSAKDCQLLFGPGLDELPHEDFGRHLAEADVESISDLIFGSPEAPTGTPIFLAQYLRLREWILIPERRPSGSARILILRIFMQSRLYRVRQSLAARRRLPELDQILALEEESRALSEIESLEEEDSGATTGREERILKARIHATLVKSFSVDAIGSGLVQDQELSSRTEDCKKLLEQLQHSRNLLDRYAVTIQLITLMWQRFLIFKTAIPDDLLPYLNQAEEIFTAIRKDLSGMNPSEGLAARAQLSHDYSQRQHYNFALAATLTALEKSSDQSARTPTTESISEVAQKHQRVLQWSLRSKGRGFVDILKSEVPLQNEDAKIPLIESSRPLGSAVAHIEELNELIETLPENVVIVDYIDVRYSPNPARFVAVIYRRGLKSLPVNLEHIAIEKLDRWVQDNLETSRKDAPCQLAGDHAMNKLEMLTGLLEPFCGNESTPLILPGETVIICPTGSLNRIPLHAIPVHGQPFIERNPVVYFQSLMMLTWLWVKHQKQSLAVTPAPSKVSVINPMPDAWKDGTLVASTTPVASLAKSLGAEFQHGFNLKKTTVLKAIESSSVFHYHGHVTFNPRSALDSVLILNEKAYKTLNSRQVGCEVITARNLFDCKLKDQALAVLVGCGSGVTTVSSLDDVLGLPTALFYAGAGAVISTLWPTDDEDGATFATEFYHAVAEQRQALITTATTNSSMFGPTVDLAKATQMAIQRLRGDPNRKDKQVPYHWAGFTLNGLWMLPNDTFPLAV